MEADPPIDLSLSGHVFTNGGGGASLDNTNFRFGAGSGDTDGTANAVWHTPDSDDWTMGNQPFTMEAMVRPSTLSGTDIFLSHYETSNNKQFQWSRATQAFRITYSTTGANDVTVDYASAFPTANIWYHAVLERDAYNIMRGYINGKLIGVTDLTGVTWYESAASRLFISGRDFGTGNEWNGQIDEVRITKGIARYA
jgi:hypothetical protein